MDVYECRKFNTFIAKIFTLVFRSDRKSSLQRIADIGINVYAEEMEQKGMQVLRRK